MKKTKHKHKKQFAEDITKYGETVPTTFSWISSETQAKIAEQLSKPIK